MTAKGTDRARRSNTAQRRTRSPRGQGQNAVGLQRSPGGFATTSCPVRAHSLRGRPGVENQESKKKTGKIKGQSYVQMYLTWVLHLRERMRARIQA